MSGFLNHTKKARPNLAKVTNPAKAVEKRALAAKEKILEIEKRASKTEEKLAEAIKRASNVEKA